MKKRERLNLIDFNEHFSLEVNYYSLSLLNLGLEKLFIICFMENVRFVDRVNRLKNAYQ